MSLHLFRYICSFIAFITLSSPQSIPWIFIPLVLLRIFLFSLLLRTYIFPWLLARMSRHIRIRSISLRSIRGLYIRKGTRTIRVERIGYVYSSSEGPALVAITIEGFSVEVFQPEPKVFLRRKHKRSITMADLSEFQHRFWVFMSSVVALLDPAVRPILRHLMTGLLQLVIRWLPFITNALSFHIQNTTVTFVGLPRAEITCNEINLHAALKFKELPRVNSIPLERVPEPRRPRLSFGVAAWRRRFTKNLRKAWDRVLEQTDGTASIVLDSRDLSGILRSEDGDIQEVFSLPGVMKVAANFGFNPKTGATDAYSLTSDVSLGEILARADRLAHFLQVLKPFQGDPSPPVSPGFPSLPNDSPISPLHHTSSLPLLGPKLPRSPFLKALSVSFRASSSKLRSQEPCRRLKSIKTTGALSFLRRLTINVASIKLKSKKPSDTYELIVNNVNVNVGLSDPSNNPIHCDHFGNGHESKTEIFDPDIYSASLSVREMKVNRVSKYDSLQLVRVGKLDLGMTVTQWPLPWLPTSPFLAGDPNGPFLGVRLHVDGIHVVERVEFLKNLVEEINSHRPTSPRFPASPSPSSTSTSIHMPRVVVHVYFGPIIARLLTGEGGLRKSLEMRTDGFEASVSSRYAAVFSQVALSDSTCDYLPLRLDFTAMLNLRSTFVKTRRKWSFKATSFPPTNEPDFMEDPSILTLDVFDMTITGTMSANIQEKTSDLAMPDISSHVTEIQCTSDLLSLELWNPAAVDCLGRVLSSLSSNRHTVDKSAKPQKPLSHSFPGNILFSATFQRILIFAASHDHSPEAPDHLSRGVAFCGHSVSIQYCSLSTRPFGESVVHQTNRRLLNLPERIFVSHVPSSSFTSESPVMATAAIEFSASRISARSISATANALDYPPALGFDEPALQEKEFLSVAGLYIPITFPRHPIDVTDGCDIIISVPTVRLNLNLGHLYHILLAARVPALILPERRITLQAPQNPSPSLNVTVDFTLETLQIMVVLPQERLALRVDTIHFSTQSKLRGVNWYSAIVWVPLQHTDGRKKFKGDERWTEFASINQAAVYKAPQSDSLSVEVGSARLRIPHEYIVANLVRDVIVSVKASRHLYHIVSLGQYFHMPTPGAEEAKVMPKIFLQIGAFCIEFADDPLESRLSMIWREGFDANKIRQDREDAFNAKERAVLNDMLGEGKAQNSDSENEIYHFSGQHSVTIAEARERLHQVHVADWRLRLESAEECRRNARIAFFPRFDSRNTSTANIVDAVSVGNDPPLFHVSAVNLSLSFDVPSFPLSQLKQFLNVQGGLPLDTEYTLLVPLHFNLTLSSLRLGLRDYAIPLLDIPAHDDITVSAWEMDTDLVIAEEIGTEKSVDWIYCPIVQDQTSAFSISVPKTMMPVKTYANPNIQVTSPGITTIAWSISCSPAVQDLMRVLDTLTHAPRDPSPAIGFWDKMRLILHWSIRVSFKGPVHFCMKGSRDPYVTDVGGSGFVLAWNGHAKILVGRQNDDQELVQVISDTFMIAIPRFHSTVGHPSSPIFHTIPFSKTCATLRGGVRFGVGFVLERSCGPECIRCHGSSFDRECRFFDFKPHYKVRLEKKAVVPVEHDLNDSYAGFRSDFLHLSLSLTSSTRAATHGHEHLQSNIHLTPKLFSHFWSWWNLFDGTMSLSIRQGSFFPSRPRSPKFGRHLATIKYRISIPKLSVMHGYIDDATDTWGDGVTPWIGAKAMIDDLQVDMHQRDQEMTIPGHLPKSTKTIHRKPFYASEVSITGLDLRAVVATFYEPIKKSVPLKTASQSSNYRQWDLPVTDSSSPWYTMDDYVELGWTAPSAPALHVLPMVTCPRFMYFKKNLALSTTPAAKSKFGNEESHRCLLGTQPSAPQVQISLAEARATVLEQMAADTHRADDKLYEINTKMISLLRQYVTVLQDAEHGSNDGNYQMPSDTITATDWAEFDNVYHVHCPKIFMDNAIRDIMLRYYQLSIARRGVEYHLATRAVKFIRNQAKAIITNDASNDEPRKHKSTAQTAALALRKILTGEGSREDSDSDESSPDDNSDDFDPMAGWSEGVSVRKSHCCLLLKPQIILQTRGTKESTCVVTALQTKLQSFFIMDDLNAEDPVSGKVMTRTHAFLSGLQMFSPTKSIFSADGCVPLEVLIDFRCESDDFDRLVPQADATLRYDKFNRLRLRNNITSAVAGRSSIDTSQSLLNENYLEDQTDLFQIYVPRFTVTAGDQHFQTISHVITKLLLFSDPTHKSRLEKLETLLITYDFTDLHSSAIVIEGIQKKLRQAIESETVAHRYSDQISVEDLFRLRAHVYMLSEELKLLFDAIKLAQDRSDNHPTQKSALLLNASSSQISWNMLADDRDLLAKLVVSESDFCWLSRQDGGTVNNLSIGNLQAFDGSRNASWPEILTKYEEVGLQSPLHKKGLVLLANWTLLPPVGGITIFECFELRLHPLRLQIDAKVGRRIMEYLWPARRERKRLEAERKKVSEVVPVASPKRMSLDSPRPLHPSRNDSMASGFHLGTPLRRLGTSRSFTDLRTTANGSPSEHRTLDRTRSSDALRADTATPDSIVRSRPRCEPVQDHTQKSGDAAEMRTRSSQKTFVLVRIPSLNLCLSIMKEESFVCRDARIKTRDLEYHNQTFSFEELVNQFIPSDMSWKGWVKMAFHQPLVPVLPVARELFAKTKWIAAPKSTSDSTGDSTLGEERTRKETIREVRRLIRIPTRKKTEPPNRGWRKASHRHPEISTEPITHGPITTEPTSLPDFVPPEMPPNKNKVLSLFQRSRSAAGKRERSTGGQTSENISDTMI